ncbi:hypothetical protein AWENTII_001714 [Aspergillus wentii]
MHGLDYTIMATTQPTNLPNIIAQQSPSSNPPDSATRAIEASPLTIPIPDNSSSNNNFASSFSQSSQLTESTFNVNERHRTLTCTIQPSRHNHESALRRNPYHTAFNIDTSTYPYQDLIKNTEIPLRELADGMMSRKEHMPFRVKRRIQAENERLGATSLMELYREGIAKAEGEAEEKANVEGR